MRRADEITLIEQIKLRVPGIGELGDAALQRRDPVDAVQFGAVGQFCWLLIGRSAQDRKRIAEMLATSPRAIAMFHSSTSLRLIAFRATRMHVVVLAIIGVSHGQHRPNSYDPRR
jgi:hypothetical protein